VLSSKTCRTYFFFNIYSLIFIKLQRHARSLNSGRCQQSKRKSQIVNASKIKKTVIIVKNANFIQIFITSNK